jgi:hypothetical protein
MATVALVVSACACHHNLHKDRSDRAATEVTWSENHHFLAKNVTSGGFTYLYAILPAEIISSTLRAGVQ